MAKILKYENDAKQKILAGVEKLEKAVATTLGPAGKNVMIDEYGSIHSTKDGVTVAKSITLKDPFENLGANAIKEVASKSNEKVGDGTTTSTILAASIYKNGLKYVQLGSNATMIKNGIAKASKKAIELIKNMSKPISTKDDIKRVCTVSANGDEEIGEIIAFVMDKIGKDGKIKVENGNTAEITSDIVEGMVLDNGYVSPYMVTNPETMEAELQEPFILVTNKKISNIQEILPVWQAISQTGKPLVMIAEDFETDIIATIVTNRLRGTLNVCCVKAPSYGDNKNNILEDIAISTGASVIADETGIKFDRALPGSNVLGMAKKVLITKDSTVIFDGFGNKDAIKARIESIKLQIEKSDEFSRDKLTDRLGKLANGVGIISVGADTEAERKEKRDRVDDAFCAAKAAVKSGIVAGGGSTLLFVGNELRKFADTLNGDEKLGALILQESLSAPARKIIENVGLDASYIVNKILEMTDLPNAGFNALSRKYVDMIEDGIIDATDVVVNEVQNAASIAGLLLTTETLIVEEPTNSKENCNCCH